LAQKFRKVNAQKTFSWVFVHDTLFPMDTTNSHTNCQDETLHSISSEEVEGIEIVPPTD